MVDLEGRARLFKALGHPARLLIVNLALRAPRHGQELAALLDLSPATVSHHLAQLVEVGLLEVERDQYYQVYSPVTALLGRPLADLVRLAGPDLDGRVEGDAYRRKVLQSFFRRGRLLQIPAQRKKRRVVLERLVEAFEPDRQYPEREVNLTLADFHEDFATLRRELVGEGLMTRRDRVYRRVGS